MATIFDVARYILEKRESEGKQTSAMKLQKLAYYSLAWSLVWDEQPVFPEMFQAWRNGPVCPDLYEVHKGMFLVESKVISQGNPEVLSATAKETIDAVLAYYGEFTPQQLSDLTHQEDPWRKTREEAGVQDGSVCQEEISHAAMAEYYEALGGQEEA